MSETSDSIERMLDENPLMVFSCYTHGQKEILDELAAEILDLLDKGIHTRENGQVEVDGRVFKRVYGKFWLWVLGAYEMVRTMDQAKPCFAESLASELKRLKKKLSLLRMPFAKQELVGKKQPIGAEASVAGVDGAARNLKYRVGNQILTMRGMINEFGKVLAEVSRANVVADHRTAYER